MKLLIGIPTHDFIHVEFVKCLMALLDQLKRDGVDYTLDIDSGTLVYIARERISNKAINEGYSHVLWLDSDMVFQPTILDDLMFSGKSFVTGVYHARRKGHASCIFKSIDIHKGVERFEEYPNEAFRIAGCGFGCVLIETDILKAVTLNKGPCFLPMAGYGEDLAFCKRATEMGFEIWCEPSVVCGHIGHIAIYPEDYERWKTTIQGDYVR